ncbi:AraC family transcriptional regulator [Phenylobacterium sp.]|jgi:AraC-like DNA-binding protein|uniref:AraC family transcriptional regulator n=1 Tax=Phenylobacterium sp. TaxID=1871053 RepID=UPI002E3639CC|nr:AraC family transcriptional regulator [Phenylobacterium sp.]HEX2561672.1 AraC family transcriptional regulator [Phenylobacterium sp.]
MEHLASLIARHAPQDGMHDMPIPGLALIRAAGPTDKVPTLHQAALCMIAQGAKVVMLAEETYRYDPATHLVVSVDLPLTGQVVEATPEQPYLCVRVDLDPALLSELMLQQPPPPGAESVRGLHLGRTTPELADAVARLVRLLERPQDAAVLAPLVRREIHYRLLTGDQAGIVRQIGAPDSRLSQVNRAIAWIRANFDRPFRIETLAREAGMSASALHQHFKAVTAMSPLQYQKQIRLQEARRLMLGEARDAQAAAFEVGYESPSQFSREYARLFGAPPARDTARLRTIGAVVVGV